MKVGVFDLEANGFLEEATVCWCLVVVDYVTGDVNSFGPNDIDRALEHLAEYDVLIGHNTISYDFPLLRKLYGWEYSGEKVDTVLMSRTQRPNRLSPPTTKAYPHSLEAWGVRLGDYKLAHDDWTQYSPEMLERCIQDAKLNVKVYDALLKEGEGEGWENAHRLNAKLFHWLQRQEEYGWPVDVKLIDKHLATLDRWINRIDSVITPRLPLVVEVLESKEEGEYKYVKKPFTKAGGLAASALRFLGATGDVSIIGGPFSRVDFRTVDLDSNAEVKDFLLALGWEPTEYNTNAKGERTSPKFSKDDEFEGIQGGLGKLLALRIKCKGRKSILEGWKSSVRDDGRISPGFSGLATTCRLKHSGIVNVPNPASGAFFAKQMRSVFTCRDGWVLVGVDSKSNQMRQLAARMVDVLPPGDEAFTKAVLTGNSKEGTDLHSLNMKRTGIKYRNTVKNFFYGCILFGAGDPKTGKILGSDAKAGKAMKETFFNEMPMLKEFLKVASERWRRSAKKRMGRWGKLEYYDGYIKGLDGRPILVPFEKDILAYYLQSDEAIQMACAYVWFQQDMEKAGYKYKEDYGTVVWYHDEIQTECKPEIAEEVGRICAECIAKAGRFYGIKVPHEGDASIGKNWAEAH